MFDDQAPPSGNPVAHFWRAALVATADLCSRTRTHRQEVDDQLLKENLPRLWPRSIVAIGGQLRDGYIIHLRF